MEDIKQKRRTLQETMSFLAALSSGIEHLVGRGANGMAFVAGKKLGAQFLEGAAHTDDPMVALKGVEHALQENHCLWRFEPFRPKNQVDLITTNPDGTRELKLVFRDCMIRQCLFCYGHEQKGSLCLMMYGFFSGAMEKVMGKKTELEIIHAGENACLKRLKILA